MTIEEFNEKLAIWVTDRMATVWCAYIFSIIGIGSIIGVVTNNVTLGLVCGAVSSYFIQLVTLPLIMYTQKRGEEKHKTSHIHAKEHSEKLDRIMDHLTKKPKPRRKVK